MRENPSIPDLDLQENIQGNPGTCWVGGIQKRKVSRRHFYYGGNQNGSCPDVLIRQSPAD